MQTSSLLVRRLRALLNTISEPSLKADITCALQGPGKLLARPEASPLQGTWGLLPFHLSHYLAPALPLPVATLVGVTVECQICALDLLDDLEDDDQTATLLRLGRRRTLLVTTALQMLALQALAALKGRIPPRRQYRLFATLNRLMLEAVTGQGRDLLTERRLPQELTVQECLEIASQKAGSLMCMACSLAAIAAGADEATIEQWAELGRVLGIAHQLDNDAHDLYDLLRDHFSPLEGMAASRVSTKSDLRRGKISLPIVLAARRASIPWPVQDVEHLDQGALDALYEGIVVTWGICLLHHEQVRDHLRAIESVGPLPLELLTLLQRR